MGKNYDSASQQDAVPSALHSVICPVVRLAQHELVGAILQIAEAQESSNARSMEVDTTLWILFFVRSGPAKLNKKHLLP